MDRDVEGFIAEAFIWVQGLGSSLTTHTHTQKKKKKNTHTTLIRTESTHACIKCRAIAVSQVLHHGVDDSNRIH